MQLVTRKAVYPYDAQIRRLAETKLLNTECLHNRIPDKQVN